MFLVLRNKCKGINIWRRAFVPWYMLTASCQSSIISFNSRSRSISLILIFLIYHLYSRLPHDVISIMKYSVLLHLNKYVLLFILNLLSEFFPVTISDLWKTVNNCLWLYFFNAIHFVYSTIHCFLGKVKSSSLFNFSLCGSCSKSLLNLMIRTIPLLEVNTVVKM